MFDIIADSACDFTPEMAQKMGVEIVPFYVSLDGEHYRKEGKEIAVRDFYQFMVDNPSAYPKTSLASIEDFEEVFRRQAEAGRPTLCLCFTGKMSGCVGSARNARELVLEDYPDAKIEVMDSAAATVTEATMVENAVAIRDAGCTLDEAVTWLEAEKSTNNIFFTVGNLDYLIKGGRIGKVSGRAANFLGIKPMILFKDGEIFSGGVARGRQKSFEKALEQLMNYLDANGGTPDATASSWATATMTKRANGSGCRPAPLCVPGTPPHSARWACCRSAPPSRSIPAPMRWAWASCAAGKSSNRRIEKILSHRERIFLCVIECYRPSVRCARREERLSLSFSSSCGAGAVWVNRTSVTRRRAVRVTTPS